MLENSLLSRSIPALGEDLVTKIKNSFFCIVGCGGVGANFAEMLVRTGATRISLIDGDIVEAKNLNRVFSFSQNNVNNPKVKVLKEKLQAINSRIKVNCYEWNLRYSNRCIEEKDKKQNEEAISVIREYDFILIAVDKNEVRIQIENICKKANNKWFSIGVEVERERLSYQCIWKPETPDSRKQIEGYGTDNGSFAAIVVEATSVGFLMLLHHLKNGNSKHFRKYQKEYKNFLPTLIKVDDEAIN